MLKQFDLRNESGLPVLREKSKFRYDGRCKHAADIVDLINQVFDAENLAEEYLWVIAYNTKLKPVGIFEVSHGLVNATLISPREIMIRLCLCGAVSFAMAHNHPSGDVTPSSLDCDITEKIKKAGELIGIRLLDHVIIGEYRTYYSFHEEGRT